MVGITEDGRRHNFESDGWDWEQLTHLGSRVQSVEECLAAAHQEHVSCPRHGVCECPNLSHLNQWRGFRMYGRILQLGIR
ncbi:hypothetical protein TNCV_4178741 [Trichonephila clavipes]|nr:hypothetical protein TNCV_4178741 [Trichonephila clavipes]